MANSLIGYSQGIVVSSYSDGASGRCGPGTLPVPVICSSAIPAAKSAFITDQSSSASPYSLSITPQGGGLGSMIIAGFLSGGTNMTLSSNVTTVNSIANTGHETFAFGWTVATTTTTVSASGTFSIPIQAAAMAAIRTNASGPLQIVNLGWNNPNGPANLPSPATAGNILVAIVGISNNNTPTTLTPPTGWTKIAEGRADNVHPFGGDCVDVLAKCSAGNDGTITISGFSIITLMEWPAST